MRLAIPLLLMVALLPGACAPGLAALDAVGATVEERPAAWHCSLERLSVGDPLCARRGGAPAPQPFCTRSLGAVDCWTWPPHATPRYRGVAEAP